MRYYFSHTKSANMKIYNSILVEVPRNQHSQVEIYDIYLSGKQLENMYS